MGDVEEGLGCTTSASGDEESGAPQTYYSRNGPLPRELDGTGSKIPFNY